MVERAILHLERELESKLPPQPYLTGNKKGIWCIPHGCFTQQLSRCHVHCFPPGRFLWQTRGWGGRVQLQSPSDFVHRLGITECSFLPARNVLVSFSPIHILWNCLHTFFSLIFAQWNTHQWASNSFQLNQDRAKKSLEDGGMRWGKQVRGIFSGAPLLKCPFLMAMMMMRKGGRQEAEAPAWLELWALAEEAGEISRKWDTVFH